MSHILHLDTYLRVFISASPTSNHKPTTKAKTNKNAIVAKHQTMIYVFIEKMIIT